MPWCPKCREEYREGFKICSDCGTELVDELPPPGASGGRQEAGGDETGEYGRAFGTKRRPAPRGDGLWCPVCRTEYRRGFTLCGDCGAALVDELPEFADEDDGSGGEGRAARFCDAYLTTAADWHEAAAIEERLNDDGIPVAKIAGENGVDIYVPEELLEDAWDVLDGAGENAGDGGPAGEEGGCREEPVPPAVGSGRLWCPVCRVEYWDEGVAVCRDCGARLVDPAAGKGGRPYRA